MMIGSGTYFWDMENTYQAFAPKSVLDNIDSNDFTELLNINETPFFEGVYYVVETPC